MGDTTKASPWWLWVGVGMIFVMALTAWASRPLPQSLQLAGGGLQLVGVITIVVEITRKRREVLDQEPMVRSALRALKRAWDRLRGKRPTPGRLDLASAGLGVSSGKARIRVGWDETLPPEEQINKILLKIDELEDQIFRLDDRLDNEHADRAAELESQTLEREKLRRLLDKRISQAVAGGLTVEAWGAALFALGISLAALGASGLVR